MSILESINIQRIDEEFTLPEFIILCKLLGIIPQEQIIEKDLEQSLSCWSKMQTLIEKDIDMKKKEIRRNVYQKTKETKD